MFFLKWQTRQVLTLPRTSVSSVFGSVQFHTRPVMLALRTPVMLCSAAHFANLL